MSTHPTSSIRARRLRCRLLIVIALTTTLLVVSAIVILAVLGPVRITNPHDYDKDQMLLRIGRAIHATFPTYCTAPNNQLSIEIDPHMAPNDVRNRWLVSCPPDPAPLHEKFVAIDVDTCEVTKPLGASIDWATIYSWTLDAQGNLPKLAVCP